MHEHLKHKYHGAVCCLIAWNSEVKYTPIWRTEDVLTESTIKYKLLAGSFAIYEKY